MSPRASLLSVPYRSTGGDEWFLEAEFLPSASGSSDLAIICHPHPLYGGEMHNNVVNALYLGLSGDCCTARFNFSGVGGSDGGYENGDGEVGQVKAVVGHLCGEFAREQGCRAWRRLHLVGYSFGAAMATPVALAMDEVSTCTAVAFPFELFPRHASDAAASFARRRRPTMFLMGDADDFTPTRAFHRWVDKFPGSVRSIIPGADHFLGGHERRIVAETRSFLNGTHLDE
ncbi:MAG: hypothetical protein JW839_17710 [Candidatus Lokiarchaeota archaeon]|nr:hypothetical protein [Candidatus Lokiarchaeota archaeon]